MAFLFVGQPASQFVPPGGYSLGGRSADVYGPWDDGAGVFYAFAINQQPWDQLFAPPGQEILFHNMYKSVDGGLTWNIVDRGGGELIRYQSAGGNLSVVRVGRTVWFLGNNVNNRRLLELSKFDFATDTYTVAVSTSTIQIADNPLPNDYYEEAFKVIGDLGNGILGVFYVRDNGIWDDLYASHYDIGTGLWGPEVLIKSGVPDNRHYSPLNCIKDSTGRLYLFCDSSTSFDAVVTDHYLHQVSMTFAGGLFTFGTFQTLTQDFALATGIPALAVGKPAVGLDWAAAERIAITAYSRTLHTVAANNFLNHLNVFHAPIADDPVWATFEIPFPEATGDGIVTPYGLWSCFWFKNYTGSESTAVFNGGELHLFASTYIENDVFPAPQSDFPSQAKLWEWTFDGVTLSNPPGIVIRYGIPDPEADKFWTFVNPSIWVAAGGTPNLLVGAFGGPGVLVYTGILDNVPYDVAERTYFIAPGEAPPPPPAPGPRIDTGTRRIVVLVPNSFDVCLAGEIPMYRRLPFVGPVCCIPELWKYFSWEEMPGDGRVFRQTGAIPTPAPIDGDVLVFQYRVPLGYDAVIRSLFNHYTGPGFVDGSGDIVWRLQLNQIYAKHLGNLTVQLGDIDSPSPMVEAIIVPSNKIIRYIVNVPNLSGGILIGNSQIVCGIEGWLIPRAH